MTLDRQGTCTMHSDVVTDGLADALAGWRTALGEAAVLTGGAVERYRRDTSPLARGIPAVLRPTDAAQIPAVLRIAHGHRVPLYPISTGRNWGYGTANPVMDGCVLLDLSALRRILAVDEELGTAVVEPGVTQGDLQAFLDDEGLPFMVPTTGAGPSCSLVGNALERGYGITPCSDHFQAVLAIEAVLPDGEVYRSPLSDASGAAVFKWGIGPYLDGLFSQGNFGVVTRMTIALARRPESVKAAYFWIDRDEGLEGAVAAVREILRVAGANVGGINLMNDVRVLAMSRPYPHEAAGGDGMLPAETVRRMAGDMAVTPWMGVAALYGSRRHVAATCSVMRRLLKPHVRRVAFFDDGRIGFLRSLLGMLPAALGRRFAAAAAKMADGLALMEGRPNEVALSLPYWKMPAAPAATGLDPARDGCGLLWYAPVVPMRPGSVRHYVEIARRECRHHGFEAPITLTSLSERAFDSTLPLLFDGRDAAQGERARACYRALVEAGRRDGFRPYRTGVAAMPLLMDETDTFWRLGARLKRAVDPAGIVAPGRYSTAGTTWGDHSMGGKE